MVSWNLGQINIRSGERYYIKQSINLWLIVNLLSVYLLLGWNRLRNLSTLRYLIWSNSSLQKNSMRQFRCSMGKQNPSYLIKGSKNLFKKKWKKWSNNLGTFSWKIWCISFNQCRYSVPNIIVRRRYHEIAVWTVSHIPLPERLYITLHSR